MGKPGTAIPYQRAVNQIAVRREPPELKHLSRARKKTSTEIPLVVASERGRGQTEGSNIFGVTDRHHDQRYLDERHGKAGETV